MKIAKKIGIVLLILIAIPLIAALFVPKKFNAESEITINKPRQEVFDYIKFIKNQENFGVWYRMDSTMKKEYEGSDGTVGFTYKWNGEKMGEGKQIITNIVEGEKIESDLDFGFGDAAHAYLSVEEISPDETLVKWGITGKTPYPWNLMSLFFDMSKDFEEGLKNLKDVLENQQSSHTMKKVQYTINIKASAEKVYKTMLGIDNIKTYEQWTAAFNPTSTYEGKWDKGSKIYFVGTDEDGRRGGMVSEVREIIPNKFVGIVHYGILDGDNEITEGAEVEKWAGAHENYSYEENNGITTVTIDIDVTEDFIDYYNTTCPQALEKLKNICESK
ncbi:MAG: SRPBCC family protein [Bacteroidetes bacterium]|nr:SRPBCC family protein [Bacteroidota bacterium]